MTQPDYHSEHAIETYKSLIQLGTFGLKFIQVVNGGAIIALLAYLGDVTNSGSEPPNVITPMIFFIAGLLLGGAAIFTTYITKLQLYNEGTEVSRRGSHKTMLWMSIGLSGLGLLSFAVGALIAANVFVN